MDQTKNTWEQNKGTCTSEQKGQKEGIVHKVGDAIEHAGDTLKEKGYQKAGQAVHDLGDKIEHMNDKKDTSDRI